MEINTGDTNINFNNTTSAFDSLLVTVAGNDYFDVKALQKIQTEELRDAFYDWASDEFLTEDEEDKSVTSEIIQGLEEYRESWENFNTKELKKDAIKAQIEKLEKNTIYELTLEEAVDNKKKIEALKAQLSQIQ